jgi:hypothetical protein
VAAECVFAWYRLADTSAREEIPFVPGHALEIRAIHGTKTKSDKVDSEKIAHLLRAGLLPKACAYPAEMRPTRDLLRRGMFLGRRAEALADLQIINSRYNLLPFPRKLAYVANRAGVLDRLGDPGVRKTVAVDLGVIEQLDHLIADLELFLTAQEGPQSAQLLPPESAWLVDLSFPAFLRGRIPHGVRFQVGAKPNPLVCLRAANRRA